VDVAATTRVALPTRIKLDKRTNKNSHTIFNSLCSEGQVTLPRQNSDHQVNKSEHGADMSRGQLHMQRTWHITCWAPVHAQ
jgi:hypothetical protein